MDGRGRRGRPRQQPPGGGPGRAHRDKTTHQQPDPNGANQGADPPRQRGAFQPRGSLGAHGLWPLRCEPRQERRVGSGRVLLQEGRQSNGSRAAQDGPRRQREEPATKATGNESPLGTAGNERQRPPGPRDRRRCSSLPPAHQPRRIGFMFLEELLQKDPSEVAITLASSAGLEEALSQTAMRPGFLQLLCQVLRKACCSRLDRQSIQQLLGTVKESNFLKICLPQYVSGMLTEAVPAVRQQCPEHISNIVALVQELVSVFPASSIQKVAVLMPLLPMAVNALRASGVDFTEEGERHLEKVQGLIQHLQEKKREGTLRLDSCTRLEPLAPGQGGEEEYRAMSVYPTYEEVHSGEKAFLRPNILSRPFESPAVYLDTHFRLLREDFVRPLREGIVQLLHCFEDKGLRKKRFDDIRVYFDARIQAPLCAGNGIDHKVTFDTKALKSVRWENSKRLLYGSLVCLSKDNFETFLFATVSHRDSQDLQQGVVHLSFCEPSRPLLAEVRPSDTFLMVETTAYFEAYRHVLQGLQEIEEEDVPFQKYIVRCESQVGAPAYLEGEGGSSTYDLRCLVKEPAAAQGQEGPEDLGGLGGCWTDILKPHQWPAKDALGLDESQLQALQLALTKELAIIQGPPGTGKTYVGLKIVEALLRNQAVRGESPILVVCYTNHALDQFLEGIHVFQEKGIVRVGGRSSSESLKQFTLRELRSKGEFWKGLPSHLRLGYNDISSQMQEAKFELDKGVALLECGQQGVLHECHLRSYISSQHWDSLAQGQDMIWMDRQNSFILNWLGLSTRPFYRHVGDGQAGADNAGAPEEEEEEEEERQEGEEELLLAITEEADLIQAERLLDQDEVGRPRPQKWKPRKDVVQLDDLFLAMKLEEEEEEDPLHKEEDWEVQPKQKKKMKKRARTELRKAHGMTEAEAAAVQDVWGLTLGARWRLYRHWVQKYQANIWRSVLRHEETYQGAAERLAELRLQEDLCILQKARVVGMTTTGAARYRQVLQQVAPRVVIVEEAAEVLEAHTITTLSRACQHLILIGDHQQLRPSANVYDLAKNFNLEVSLFERLVKVGLPFVRLNFQHRMRPEIARLLTPHIYQDLENHPSVLQYENIKGISSNLFFVEHNIPEQEIQEGRSHQNPHEAQFVVGLCKYLLCQGYQPAQITILTTYTGQLFCLRKLLPAQTFQGVKVHVVDKYQGEENDVILLSLVRSNREGRVGFLQASNRVCVALSRAKKGLYCIGNMAMLSKVPLWSKIQHALRKKGHMGRALPLFCQNHPETMTEVAQVADFSKVPEGGCSRPCDARLGCGHVCPRACHPYDPWHKDFQCMKPCQKVLCADGHRCTRPCFQPCGKCYVKVLKTMPGCGHQQAVPCSTPVEDFCCQEPCGKVLSCGHGCTLICGRECARHCSELVQVTLRCGHSQEVPCSTAAGVADRCLVPCRAKCLGVLECSHHCPGTCYSCSCGRFHERCRSPCSRLLICSHKCQEPCTSDCPPCRRRCQNRCVHSRCQKKCGELCTPCVEPCEWHCLHHQCHRLCSEPCDRPRCDEACPKHLPCGHPCAGMCGEPCPQKCLVCHREELTQIFFGFEDEPGARFVQLEDCGHIFEAQGLDCYMDGGEEEEEERRGSVAIKLKVCPSCQTPVRRNLRYGMLVKRSLAEVEAVKARIQGCPAEIEAGRQRLMGLLVEKAPLKKNLPDRYELLLQKLVEPSLCSGGLGLMEHLLAFYGQLAELTEATRKADPRDWAGVRKRLAEVDRWLERPRHSFTNQELSELGCEFRRLASLVEVLARCLAVRGKMEPATSGLVSQLRQLLEGPGRFTPEDEELVKAKMEALDAALPKSGLGISEVERKQIVTAVTGQSRGHWFKCPNGHIYVITECGGAMERSRCPECQEAIGGTNHRLESSNQLAPEMDGATLAAWPGTTNHPLDMANLLRLH